MGKTSLNWKDMRFWTSETWAHIQSEIELCKDLCPHQHHIFRALTLTPLPTVKVVILGQDPYHGGQATGLAFSVWPFVQPRSLPPSLRNILHELTTDYDMPMPLNGDLTPWAKRGVLLLNTYLTCRMGQPLAHQHLGWTLFTKEVCYRVLQANPNAVFILWGKHAQEFTKDLKIRNLIKSSHPSPYSASVEAAGSQSFFGSRPFSRANGLLAASLQEPINWSLS